MSLPELIATRCAEILAETKKAAESARRSIGQLTRKRR